MSPFWILFIAKDEGGDGNNWSYKTYKAPVRMSPPTNQHPVFLQAGCPSCHPANGDVSKHWSEFTTNSKAKNKRVLVCIYIQNNPVTDSLCQRRRIREECFDQLLDGSPASFQNFRVHLLEQFLTGKLSENTRSQLGVSLLYLRMQTETATLHLTLPGIQRVQLSS